MKKLIKWIVIIVVLLTAICAGVILFLLNPAVEKLRPAIVQKLSAALKTPVEIGGISASVFPKTELELKDLKIAGAQGASVERFFADMSINDMLAGKIAFTNVRLEKPRLTLVRAKDGTIQLGEMRFGGPETKAEKKPAAPSSEPGKPDPEKAAPAQAASESAAALQIRNLTVVGGEVQYRDEALPKPLDFLIKDLALNLRDFDLNKTSPIELKATVFGKSPGNLAVNGEILASSFLQGEPVAKIGVRWSELDLTALGPIIQGFAEKSGKLDAGGAAQLSIDAQLKNSETQAVVAFDAKAAQLVFTPSGGTTLLQKAAGIPLGATSTLRVSKDRSVNIEALDLQLGTNVLSASTVVRPSGTGPVKILLKDFDLIELSKVVVLPVQTAGKISGNLTVDPTVKPIPAVEGTLELLGVSVANPATQLEINGIQGKLQLSKNAVAAEKLALTTKGEQFVFAGNLVTIDGNRYTTAPTSISAFGGTIQLQNEIVLAGQKPLRGTLRATGVDLKRITAFAGNTSKFDLNGTLQSFSTTYDGAAADLKQTLNANFDFAAVNGEIVGVNLFALIFQKAGAIPGLSASLASFLPENYKPLVTAVDATKFDSLTIGGAIASGSRITVRQAELRNAAFILAGSGSLTTAGGVDMRTQMKLTPLVTQEMVARSEKLRLLLDRDNNLTFPVVITKGEGPLLVLPDLSELGKNAMRGATKDAAGKALDKVAPGLGDGAKSLLNKLF